MFRVFVLGGVCVCVCTVPCECLVSSQAGLIRTGQEVGGDRGGEALGTGGKHEVIMSPEASW